MVEIRTERLLLRPARISDREAMHAILSDPLAMSYWSTLPHQEMAETQAWLEGMIAIDPDVGEDFIVEFEGRVVGKAGLYRFPEAGFLFSPEVWGRGVAMEALRPIIDRAFEVHRLSSIVADVDPRNKRSLRLLGRLGFRETGQAQRTWLMGDKWCDSVYLRLPAPDG